MKTLNKGIATIPNKGGKDEEYTATLGRPSPPIEVAMEQTNEGQTKTDMNARQEETLIKKAKGLKKSVTRENPERNMQLSSRAKKTKRMKMTDKEQKATKQSLRADPNQGTDGTPHKGIREIPDKGARESEINVRNSVELTGTTQQQQPQQQDQAKEGGQMETQQDVVRTSEWKEQKDSEDQK